MTVLGGIKTVGSNTSTSCRSPVIPDTHDRIGKNTKQPNSTQEKQFESADQMGHIGQIGCEVTQTLTIAGTQTLLPSGILAYTT
mmetsp:Transcript_10892/g.18899  ORF Transcript_10892/g.18899 Transcript_10892/m.18899 type:complete len:84 (+) Transcript_10892:356-607(+)